MYGLYFSSPLTISKKNYSAFKDTLPEVVFTEHRLSFHTWQFFNTCGPGRLWDLWGCCRGTIRVPAREQVRISEKHPRLPLQQSLHQSAFALVISLRLRRLCRETASASQTSEDPSTRESRNMMPCAGRDEAFEDGRVPLYRDLKRSKQA